MKTLILLCFLSATTAFAQNVAYGTVSAEPVIPQFASHASRAAMEPMRADQNLLGTFAPTVAHGERPLWEVATPAAVTPLGDSARMLKKAHETAKKAEVVWHN
jgi:hypothetical protein